MHVFALLPLLTLLGEPETGGGKRKAPPPLPDAGAIEASLLELARDRVQQGWQRLARADDHVYAIDIALLSMAFALGGDKAPYETLDALARKHLLVEEPPGLAAPIILWRRQVPEGKPEASGTTEMLRFAQAWLVGSQTFHRPEDAALARRLLRGYVLHAGQVDGTWMVRNYYDLRGRHFAINSYLIDYAPDLLVFAGTEPREESLLAVARSSLALVRRAQRANGLIDAMVQPEVRTLYPFVIFSPNDIIQIEHAAIVAEQVAKGAPAIARRLLDFALARLPKLPAAVVGRSGEPSAQESADAGTYAALVRLAVRLDAAAAVRAFRRPFLENAEWLVRAARKDSARLPETHLLGQTLLGLMFLRHFDEDKPLPPAIAGRAP